jgi:hypothetical protein
MSFSIKRMYLEDDRVQDPESSEKEVAKPSWATIESSIRRLDGVHRSMVIIGQDDPEVDFMAVGGGAEGTYRCFIYTQDGREIVLTDPSQVSEGVKDVLMGQTTSVPLDECLPLEVVLRAARTYSTTGQPDPSLSWKSR